MTMNRTNCPNCGAPIESERCPYCGTIIYDFANLEVGKDCCIRLRVDNELRVFKARVCELRINAETTASGHLESYLEMGMYIVPGENTLMTIYKQTHDEVSK